MFLSNNVVKYIKRISNKLGFFSWILISVLIGAVFFIFLHGSIPKGYLGCAGITVYAFILVLLVVSASYMTKKLSFACYAFIVSDIPLLPNMISSKLVWCHCISTMLFYLALWLFCYYLITSENSN